MWENLKVKGFKKNLKHPGPGNFTYLLRLFFAPSSFIPRPSSFRRVMAGYKISSAPDAVPVQDDHSRQNEIRETVRSDKA